MVYGTHTCGANLFCDVFIGSSSRFDDLQGLLHVSYLLTLALLLSRMSRRPVSVHDTAPAFFMATEYHQSQALSASLLHNISPAAASHIPLPMVLTDTAVSLQMHPRSR